MQRKRKLLCLILSIGMMLSCISPITQVNATSYDFVIKSDLFSHLDMTGVSVVSPADYDTSLGSTYTLSSDDTNAQELPELSYVGYGFMGWMYDSNSKYTSCATKTLSADWLNSLPSPNYLGSTNILMPIFGRTINFDYQGGTDDNNETASTYTGYGSFDAGNISSAYSSCISLSSANGLRIKKDAMPEVTKTGYTFKHWSKTPDGDEITYKENTEGNDWYYFGDDNTNGINTDEFTLYAVWEPNTYKYKYDYGDGNIHTYTTDADNNEELWIPEVDGYGFNGWYWHSGCGEGTELTELNPENLEKCWIGTGNDYHEIFSEWSEGATFKTETDKGTFEGEKEKITVTDDSLPEIVQTEEQKKKWKFIGFRGTGSSSLINEDNPTYAKSTLKAGYPSTDETDVAVYTAEYVPVYMFDATCGGTYPNAEWKDEMGDSKGNTMYWTEVQPDEADFPVCKNHKFVGWYTATDNTGTKVTSDNLSNYDEGTTFYAHYDEYPKFDPNGGSFVDVWDYEQEELITTKEPQYGDPVWSDSWSKYTYNISKPEWLYKSFLGWYTSKYDCDEIPDNVTAVSDSDFAVNSIYFAGWETTKYEIVYRNLMGGATNSNPTEYKLEDVAENPLVLVAPEKEGYGFDGWYYSSEDDYGKRYPLLSEGKVTTIDASSDANKVKNLYATWSYKLKNTEINGTVGNKITPFEILLADTTVTSAKFAMKEGSVLPEGLTLIEPDKLDDGTYSPDAVWKIGGTPTSAGTSKVTVSVDLYRGDGIEISGTDMDITINIKEPLTVAAPTTSGITYDPNKTLADVSIANGSTNDGTWVWKVPDTVPTVAKTSYTAVYTPSDAEKAKYDCDVELEKEVALTVAKATGVLPEVSASDVKYTDGMTLADVALTGENWSWKEPITAVTVGENTATAVYTPTDSENYSYETLEKELTFNAVASTPTPTAVPTPTPTAVPTPTPTAVPTPTPTATPTPIPVVFPTISGDYPYGMLLEKITLSGGSVNGVFSWKNPNDRIKLGNNGYMVVFTPEVAVQAEENNGYEQLVYVNGVAAEPEVNKLPTASSIYIGNALSTSKISGGKMLGALGEEVEGTYAWKDGTQTFDTKGDYECTAVFTPTSENYTPVDVTLEVTVKKKSSGGGGGGSSSLKYTITATAGEGGTITPDGETVVSRGKDQAYTVSANKGYEIESVKVDNKSAELTDGTYTFEKIWQDHTISVTFKKIDVADDNGDKDKDTDKDKDNDKTDVSIGFNRDEHMAYVSGYPNGEFCPDKTLTRAEAAAIICRIINMPIEENVSYPVSFIDVPEHDWEKNYIGYIEQLGIIKGYEDGTFRPDRSITRAEFATILSQIDGIDGEYASAFADVPKAHWASNYIGYAYANKWVAGYEDGTFRPDGLITRAEVVRMTNQVLKRGVAKDVLSSFEVSDYSDMSDSHWAYCEVIEASNAHTYTHDENGGEVWKSVK